MNDKLCRMQIEMHMPPTMWRAFEERQLAIIIWLEMNAQLPLRFQVFGHFPYMQHWCHIYL